MVSQKMESVGSVLARPSEKRKQNQFLLKNVLDDHEIYKMGMREHFGTENYAWKLYIVQNLSGFYKNFFNDFLDQKWSYTTNIYITSEGV